MCVDIKLMTHKCGTTVVIGLQVERALEPSLKSLAIYISVGLCQFINFTNILNVIILITVTF